ncbi:reverse transcriptase domain-containing protein [Tanacetum coccineum]
MRTRNSYFPNNSNVTIPRRQNKGRAPNIVEPELRTIVAPMAERTMEELLRAPTEGYREAIVLLEINADHFEIKTNLFQLVQANPFYGCESENPHAHINSFKMITSTLRFRNVPNDVIKLKMFPYSLEGAAKTCEAWERFKELLRACPHHGFTELTQVDTFYNGLNENEQDSLNAAAGGNLLSKTTREALNIIENKSKVRYSRNRSNVSRMNATSSKTDERIDKLADQLSTLVEIVSKKVVTPAPVKAVEETCVTCGGAHSWYNCPATDNNQASVCATTGTYNQVNPPNRVSNQMAPPGFAPVQNNGQNRNGYLRKGQKTKPKRQNRTRNGKAWGSFPSSAFPEISHQPQESLKGKSKVRNSCNKPIVAKVSTSTSTPRNFFRCSELKDMVKALLLDKKNQSPAPTPVKAVEESCVTCGGAHSYQTCPATSGNVYRDNIQEYVSQAAAANYNQGNTGYRAPISNQIRPPGFPPVQNNHVQNQGNNQNRYNQNRGNFNQAPAYQPPVHQGQIYRPQVVQPPAYQAPAYQAPAPQTHGVSKTDFDSYIKANDAVMRNMQTQGQNMQNQLTNLTDMLSKFVTSNTASTSGTLPSNTVTNPKEDLKGITTRSGVAYKGPTIPITSSSPKVIERDTEVTKDTMHPTNNGSTEDVPPPVVPIVN